MENNSLTIIKTERCLADLRHGFPVLLKHQNKKYAVLATETIGAESLKIIKKLNIDEINIVLTGKRLLHLIPNFKSAKINLVEFNNDSVLNLRKICGADFAKVDIAGRGINKASIVEKNALELVKLAELLPSALVCEVDTDKKYEDFLQIDTKQIAAYKASIDVSMTKLCETNLVLKGDIKAKVIAFRPNLGGREHYAIIVAKPKLNEAPMVRIHSSCYTGDLLSSLACDCRDQLTDAIKIMAENGGGVVLYLLQEGRGIGLPNKLRAYHLKDKGMDTVDANEALGFDDDERLFVPAAKILEILKIKEVSLLTNNPRKAKGLTDCSIKVKKCVPVITKTNEHNEHYLATKAKRLGHNI